MKFSLAAVTAALTVLALPATTAFVVPASAASRTPTSLFAESTATKPYTFTKSDEIFAEAKTVSSFVLLVCCSCLLFVQKFSCEKWKIASVSACILFRFSHPVHLSGH
jgi:hypothetical protein